MSQLDYSRGKSAGRRQGRAQAFREVDKAEMACIAEIMAVNGSFRQGVMDAQKFVETNFGNVEDHVDDSKIDLDFRGGFLWLFKREAGEQDGSDVMKSAKSILREHFLAVAGTPNFGGQASKAMHRHKDDLGFSYERGRAAQFVLGLSEMDFARAGFLAYLSNVADRLRELDGDDLVEKLEEAKNALAQNDRIEHYGEFLERALDQYAQQLSSAVASSVSAAVQGYNGPKI